MSIEEQTVHQRKRPNSNLVNSKEISQIKLDLIPFVPVLSMETAHSQTLLGHFIKSEDFAQSARQMFLTLPDGDRMSLKIYEHHPVKLERKNAVVTLFHGLAGDHKSDYIQRSAKLAFDLGYTVVMVDHRGAGGAEGMAKRPYHSGRGEDASEVSLKLREMFPNKKQIFIGFSMSGSILLNLVTQRVGEHLPDFCVVVNAPINLQRASEKLMTGITRLYDLRFYFILKRMIKKVYPQMPLPIVATTRVIDDVFTSQKSGFVDGMDYYASCSTHRFLDQVVVPTFVLTSKDDPFIDFQDYEAASWNDMTHRTFVDHGGHMGYISKHKSTKYGIRWMDDYLHKVLTAIEDISTLV